MKCADPVLCYLDSKGNRKFRHFSFAKKSIQGIPSDHLVFDCGKCLSCRKKRARELAVRCVLHASLYRDNCFLTLTYDEAKDGYHNEFCYSDVQKFKKRLRQMVYRESGRRVAVFNVHEYGSNGKKHWHLIVFNYNFEDRVMHTVRRGLPLFKSDKLAKIWPYGFSSIGSVSEASAMYQAQYMEKDFKHGYEGTKKKSCSRHSGIGKPYFMQHFRQLLSLGYIPFSEKKVGLPRYFEKLARRHWAHFNRPDLFFSTYCREAVYRPFVKDEPSLEISRFWESYESRKRERILILEENWCGTLEEFFETGVDPDFVQANNNALYDLVNKQKLERF